MVCLLALAILSGAKEHRSVYGKSASEWAADLQTPNVRHREAIEALAVLGPDAAEAVPALAKTLGGEDGCEAANALAKIGPPAVPALITELKKPHDSQVMYDDWHCVVDALGEIGPEAAAAIPTLIPSLDDRSQDARVVRTLGEIGPSAVPALRGALRSQQVRIRRNAASALGLIQGPEADAALVDAFGDDDMEVAAVVARQFGARVAPGGSQVATLLSQMRARQPRVRETAVLAVLDSPALDLVDVQQQLQALAKDPEVRVRRAAVAVLSKRLADPQTKTALQSALQDSDWAVRKTARDALR